jgi:POT family proton-dependent oligopeptide transporter
MVAGLTLEFTVRENLPISAWLVAVVELSERFTFYGCQDLFQNYIQRPLDGRLGRSALGMGHQKATALNTFFSLWLRYDFRPATKPPTHYAAVTPIFGAIVADQYLGRYKTIVYFAGLYIIGLLILFLTSLPISLQHGAGLGGFITALLIIGIGTGGLNPTSVRL